MREIDNYATFKKIYEVPILRSRAPDCTSKEADVGAGRLEQVWILWTLVKSRADADPAFERGEELRAPTRGDDPQRLPSA
jgi:hypothetical protein